MKTWESRRGRTLSNKSGIQVPNQDAWVFSRTHLIFLMGLPHRPSSVYTKILYIQRFCEHTKINKPNRVLQCCSTSRETKQNIFPTYDPPCPPRNPSQRAMDTFLLEACSFTLPVPAQRYLAISLLCNGQARRVIILKSVL